MAVVLFASSMVMTTGEECFENFAGMTDIVVPIMVTASLEGNKKLLRIADTYRESLNLRQRVEFDKGLNLQIAGVLPYSLAATSFVYTQSAFFEKDECLKKNYKSKAKILYALTVLSISYNVYSLYSAQQNVRSMHNPVSEQNIGSVD